MELLWVTDATYLDGYKISLAFNDGIKKVVDLSDYHFNGIFAPLRDVENFKKFHLSDWTIEWYNGADIAPESLYAM
jgi:hypothetical protein